MNILIIGSGGREHALAWQAAQSDQVQHVFVAPGNAGTALEDKVQNVAIAADNISKLIEFAKAQPIELTIVGPEAPLAAGIVDQFQQHELACFGPCQAAAMLESSKAYSKQFMVQHGIPTATYAKFSDTDAAKQYLQSHSLPVVIKADGLAAGKGVVIAQTLADAETAVTDMLAENRFGGAGSTIVIEEFLEGIEASFMVIADGKTALPLASSQDHKQRDDGDQGPNTGGMGAYSPTPFITDALKPRIMEEVIMPVLDGMAAAGHPYTGFLYAGLMLLPNGDIKVLEFNCRLGDPETQPILMRLKSSIVDLCFAALDGTLHKQTIKWDKRIALGVVLAADGYPDSYHKGDTIIGLADINNHTIKVFHAGTKQENGNVVTNGGRVLCVTALGDDINAAQQLAYNTVNKIHWENMYYRRDIGDKAKQHTA